MATVSATPRTNRITVGAPSAGPFLVGFRLFSTAIEVYVDGLKRTDWTLASDFTAGYDDNASITFLAPLAAAAEIQIDSCEIPEREEDYANPDPGLTRKLNSELARVTAAVSDLYMKMGRTIRALEDIAPIESASVIDLANLAQYADDAETAAAEADQARDEVLAIQQLIPRRAGPWLTATSYVFGDLVQEGGSTYFCLLPHTSGTFSTDLAALRWEIWAQKGAAGVGSGDVIAANNGSDFANAATVRSNLGLAIGTNVQAFNQLLGAVSGLAANGFMARLSGSTAAVRTMTGSAGIAVTNGDGVSGNPTFALTFASQAEAEAGTEATKPVTSQRVAQAIVALGEKSRVLLASKTASASATLDFTEFNNATYRYYEFELEDVKPATDQVSLRMRFSSNGGSSYDAGATDYQFAGKGAITASLETIETSGGADVILLTDGAILGNAGNETGVAGTLKLFSAGNASAQTKVNGLVSYDSFASNIGVWVVSGRRVALQDTDAVRFLMSSGNIASGTIRMYGIRA